MTHITKLTSLLAVTVMALMSSQANADEYGHIDQLAVEIQAKTRLLLQESIHYRHTPQYGYIVNDARELYKTASHIHDVTHFEGNLTHLAIDLAALNRQFHHLEEVFDQAEYEDAQGARRIQSNTAHVKQLLNAIEDCICQIQADVDRLQTPVVVVSRPVYKRPVYKAPVYRAPVYKAPVYKAPVSKRPVYKKPNYTPVNRRPVYSGNKKQGGKGQKRGNQRYGRSGITIGGGSSKIHIRF